MGGREEWCGIGVGMGTSGSGAGVGEDQGREYLEIQEMGGILGWVMWKPSLVETLRILCDLSKVS